MKRFRVQPAEWVYGDAWSVTMDGKVIDTYRSLAMAQAYVDFMNRRVS